MSAVYQHEGIHFQYPENWRVLDESTEWPHEIFVESPDGAFWSLHVYSPPEDPEQLANDVLQAMQNEYEGVEAEAVQETIGPVDAHGFDMFFFYLDLVVRCRARTFVLGDRTFVLMMQGEDRDFDKLTPVFNAMTHSLLQNLLRA